MRRQGLVFLLAASLLVFGCSSNDEKPEGATDTPAAEGEAASLDGGDTAAPSGDAALDQASTDGLDAPAETPPPADGNGDLTADFGTETPPADTAAPTEPAPESVAVAEPTPDTSAESIASEPPPEEAPPAPKASLKKIKDHPFESNGRNLNTVYILRDGDTVKSVTNKIFGDGSKRKELVADNPHLKNGVKAGNKVYYQSPLRPDDKDSMKTFYEDRGIPAQTYTAKAGDDLKQVSSELLGSKNAWKEIWATNIDLESKGPLTEGTQLRYWSSDTAAAPVVAEQPATPPAPEVAANVPPPPADIPPPPPADVPPPPAAGTVDIPPPPPSDVPPPPLDDAPKAKKKIIAKNEDLDKETTMALGLALILILAALALFVIIKKSRAKKMRLGQTQVG